MMTTIMTSMTLASMLSFCPLILVDLKAWVKVSRILSYLRKIDIFLTMTTNPHWAKIECELLPVQMASDRPDLVAQVWCRRRWLLIISTSMGNLGVQPLTFIQLNSCWSSHVNSVNVRNMKWVYQLMGNLVFSHVINLLKNVQDSWKCFRILIT